MLCPALADLKTGKSTVLAEGRDFYTSPRLNADSTKVTSRCMAGEYGRDHINQAVVLSPVILRCLRIPCCVHPMLCGTRLTGGADVRLQLAWVCYDHPNMPWDDTELWVADVGETGELSKQRKVLQGSVLHKQHKVHVCTSHMQCSSATTYIACVSVCMHRRMWLCSCQYCGSEVDAESLHG